MEFSLKMSLLFITASFYFLNLMNKLELFAISSSHFGSFNDPDPGDRMAERGVPQEGAGGAGSTAARMGLARAMLGIAMA